MKDPGSGYRWNPPPGWPEAPVGFNPPTGWKPDPAWPPAPDGWNYWVPVSALPVNTPVASPYATPPPSSSPSQTTKIMACVGITLGTIGIIGAISNSSTPNGTTSVSTAGTTHDSPATVTTAPPDQATNDPSATFIAKQFAAQIDPLEQLAATYRAKVRAHDDAGARDAAGQLYSAVATLPAIIGNQGLFGSDAHAALPAVKAAAARYGNALNDMTVASATQQHALEKQVPALASDFQVALQAFASSFGYNVPRV